MIHMEYLVKHEFTRQKRARPTFFLGIARLFVINQLTRYYLEQSSSMFPVNRGYDKSKPLVAKTLVANGVYLRSHLIML